MNKTTVRTFLRKTEKVKIKNQPERNSPQPDNEFSNEPLLRLFTDFYSV